MRGHIALALAVAAGIAVVEARVADACGCLSPPAVTEGEYAVNQRAEQIIFEVEPGWVTAHVLIKYAGAPEAFAWIIPAPEAPQLAISPSSAFGLIDRMTAPDVDADVENICPISEWSCRYHARPSCGFQSAVDDDGAVADAGAPGDAGTGQPPVTVIDEQTVGDYQTVTFRASEAAAAVEWLRTNGFIVNPTTSIYMEPYIQQNMVFVAAKLVPGAGVTAIKPLRMRYRAAFPMIPLVLTAVAAEPHLTVTSYIYAGQAFRPMGHPIVSIDPARIARDRSNRVNYPMAMSRAIDEAGGDGFIVEYRGRAERPDVGQSGQSGMCCGQPGDFCRVANDNQCQCPRDEYDRADCMKIGDLLDGVALADDLAARHTHLTRLTTRVSPEEMSFDPTFAPDYDAATTGRLVVRGTQPSLASCSSDVIPSTSFREIVARQECATTYCGTGQCAITEYGAGCACGPGQVAHRFIDLDGKPSSTCIPKVPPVDLRAGGLVLPDACANVGCGAGRCIDRNGVAVCECDPGNAAVVSAAGAGQVAPLCAPIAASAGSPGAEDFSEPLRALEVCAPAPPTCGKDGWLVRTPSARPGVDCGGLTPPKHLTVAPDKPTCGFFGCGGCDSGGGSPLAAAGGTLLVVLVLGKRRRAKGVR